MYRVMDVSWNKRRRLGATTICDNLHHIINKNGLNKKNLCYLGSACFSKYKNSGIIVISA